MIDLVPGIKYHVTGIILLQVVGYPSIMSTITTSNPKQEISDMNPFSK
ncbi:hypothetical protein PCCS19_15230 [Paenibacillus sp. CCS19]|nr:hypothetical protein PCCS19_15230 [Paenibacillus cellulosilyticus]